jgi:hypothetical protein
MRHHGILRRTLAASVATVGIAAGAPPAGAQMFGAPQTAAPRSLTIVGRMGIEMSEMAARHEIAFRPFAPPRRIVAVALLPPFHGDDVRANRGIGFEYNAAGDRRYVLAQWPANGGTIKRFALLAQNELDCADARTFPRGTKPNGIVWSTPHGLIMTLQADGENDARTLETEWRKLIRRGVCR